MQAIEIISYLEYLLRENIKLEDKKYIEIMNVEVTGHLFYDADSVLLSQSYDELKKACLYLTKNLIRDINLKFELQIKNLNEQGFESLFKETSLHTSSVIGLSNNFIKLINWAQNTIKKLDEYGKEKFKQDLTNCLDVTFYQSPEILEEVLLNHKIFDTEQRLKALEILDNAGEFNQDEFIKLNQLISNQIAIKASENLENLSYQYFQKLQDKDFKIHRYDEIKIHPMFVHLF
jgi:hypothetical protein